MKQLFSFSPIWHNQGVAIVRVIVGAMMIYHGWEIFNTTKMNEYAVWDSFKKYSAPLMMVYIGKATELLAGILLLLGLFTRLAALFLIFTMLYIAFFVGEGRIWYEEQHPFLFVLLGAVFFFTGGGKWSFDYLFFGSNKYFNLNDTK